MPLVQYHVTAQLLDPFSLVQVRAANPNRTLRAQDGDLLVIFLVIRISGRPNDQEIHRSYEWSDYNQSICDLTSYEMKKEEIIKRRDEMKTCLTLRLAKAQ